MRRTHRPVDKGEEAIINDMDKEIIIEPEVINNIMQESKTLKRPPRY